LVKINNINFCNFRNFQNQDFLFEKKTNIFFGNNGTGKTNVLEGISLIGKGRGIRNAQLNNLINRNKETFLINASVSINENNYETQIQSVFLNDKYKKIININGDTSKEILSFFESSISFLLFLPEMERLFQSSPSTRRNFIDRLIFSHVKNYNSTINKYKKKLLERSKILQENNFDKSWIEVVEKDISFLALQIYQLRIQQLNLLNENIVILNRNNNYAFKINLKILDEFYSSSLDIDTYLNYLKNFREYDKKYGGSKIGPHKSDISVTVDNGFEASQLSTGQQKTIVLLILIAQCNYLINDKKIQPIFLLDEICSHLDSNNRQILLDMINNFDIQLFLTGTEKAMFSFISTNVKFYNIEEE
tara:strand:- start:409 stop:1497 length:1089 start_codon:yes stop_codon:yes gene_type:complete